MSSEVKQSLFVTLILILLAALVGCSSSGSGSDVVVLSESGQHPSGWLVRGSGNFHGVAYLEDWEPCTECHGRNLKGGIAKVSCNVTSRDGRVCHPGIDAPHLGDLLERDGSISTDQAALLCGKCHGLDADLKFQCQRCHSDAGDDSDPLSGALKARYPDVYPFGFGSAPNVQVHSSEVVGTKYLGWQAECTTCHNPHAQEQNNFFGTGYGKLIKRSMSYFNNITLETLEGQIEFTVPTGPGSFADGPPHDENICEVCHTRTNHHQADGTAPGGQEHFSGQNCTQCHPHRAGFALSFGGEGLALPGAHSAQAFAENCDYCHVEDSPGQVNFSAVIPNANCNQCHSESGALKFDFPEAPNVMSHLGRACVECHNPMFEQSNASLVRSTIAGSVVPNSNVLFTAQSGFGSFADGPPYEENVCNTCHTQTLFHQADGDALISQSHNDGTQCTVCHSHADGFSPDRTPPPPPHDQFSCEACHETGDSYRLNADIPNSACEKCHGIGTPGGSSGGSDIKLKSHFGEKIVDAETGEAITLRCVECHNPMREQINFRATTNRTFIRSTIRGNQIAFEATTGPYGFANDSGKPADMEAKNYVCNTCHTQTSHHQNDGTAPLGQLHFDGQDCTACHEHAGGFAPPFALQEGDSPTHVSALVNRDGTENPDSPDLVCGKCHDLNNIQSDQRGQCQRCHADAGDPSDPLNGTSKEAYPDVAPYGYGNALNVQTHGSLAVGDKYGEWSVDCAVCHNPHVQEQNNTFGSSYGKLINRSISYTNQETGESISSVVEFTSATGPGSFADGAPHAENICETCHTRTDHHRNDGTAPKGQSHFDGARCTDCHLHSVGFARPFAATGGANPPHIATLLVRDDNSIHPDNESLLCGKCHDLNDFQNDLKFQCQRCHADAQDPSNALNGVLKEQYPDAYPFGFGSAPNVAIHASDVVGTTYGQWGAECVTCHNPHSQEQNNTFGTAYGKLLKRTIAFENQATGETINSAVQLIAPTGFGSFADGPPHDENICETCHTRTLHHQNDGDAPEQSHFDEQKCTTCHRHSDGFAPTAGRPQPPHNTDFFTANCTFCHLTDTDGVELFSAPIPDEECTKCHSTRLSHSSELSGTGKYDYATECIDCHNPMFAERENIKSVRRFISQSADPDSTVVYTSEKGPGSLADGPPFDANVCETCHSQTSHHRYDGQAPGDLDNAGNYVGHFDGEDCTKCHNHNNAFVPF
jgi:hypothetical protein